MKYILLLVLFFTSSLIAFTATEKKVRIDSSTIEVRTPDDSKIKKYLTQKVFQYEPKPKVHIKVGWFRRFLRWLLRILEFMFSPSIPARFLRYAILVALIVFIILKLLNARFSTLFYKPGSKVIIPISELDIDIENMKLDEMIEEEISRKRYRKAIRLLYVKLLKLLSKYNLIQWKKGKTDFDYFMELSGSSLQYDFKKLSLLYEYTWYGNFKPRENQFTSAYQDFNTIFKQVDVKKE